MDEPQRNVVLAVCGLADLITDHFCFEVEAAINRLQDRDVVDRLGSDLARGHS